MKYVSASVIALSALLFASYVHVSYAYTTTGQYAYTPNNHTGIYMVKYEFGHGDHDVHMPILATNDNVISDYKVSYQIVGKDGIPAKGTTAGMVVSTAPYREGMYVVEKGTRETLTLLVFYTPELSTENEYHLEVTHLPFTFDESEELKLNPSELKYYKTETLTLK